MATMASSQYYRRKNGSFCLQAAKSPPYDASLDFGEKVVIYSNKTSKAYKHRVDYNQKTLQWCLHQLRETDSGTYRLRVMKDDKVTDHSLVLVVEGKDFSVVFAVTLQCSCGINLSDQEGRYVA